jgi:hypothetical protein
MANKKISQLDPSLKNLRDADYLECEPHDGTKSYRYTLEQVRAVEKAEREATDDAIIGAVGLDTDGSLIPFSGSNYVDAATDIANAISLLDASIASNIPSSVSVANVGDGDGEVYKDTVAGQINLKTIKGGTYVTVTDNTNDVTIDSRELASVIDSKGEMIVGDASGDASTLNPVNDGKNYILTEKDANVNWKNISDTVALGINDSGQAASVVDDHKFGVTKTGEGLSYITFNNLKDTLLSSPEFKRNIYTQISSITVENATKTYIIANSSGIEIPAEYLVSGKTIRVTIMGYHICGTADDADLSVYLYPTISAETGIFTDSIRNYVLTGNNPFVVNLDITIRTEGTSGRGYASGVVTLGGGTGELQDYTKSYYIASKGEFSINTTVNNILALSYQYDTSIAANKTYINTGVVELI